MGNIQQGCAVPGQPPTRPIQAVRHAVLVLRAFSVAEPTLGVNEIARRVGLNRSSISRILQTLAEAGLVQQEPLTGRYRLGLGLTELASIALAGLDLRHIARPHMQRLNELTRETVSLSIWDHDAAVMVEHLPAIQPVMALGWAGLRNPGHATSPSKIFLAFLDPAQTADVLAGPFPRYTSRTVTDRDGVLEDLAEIRRRGFAINEGEYQEGLNAVAAPVRDRDGRVCAALNVSAPVFRLDGAQLLELSSEVMAVAAAISRDLGAPAERPAIPGPALAPATVRADASLSRTAHSSLVPVVAGDAGE
jgi:DNA-binding IclR family transcriptional regulator